MRGLADNKLLVLISCIVYASDDCLAVKDSVIRDDSVASKYADPEAYRAPIECYECSTYSNNKYCADPFNLTDPDVKVVKCEGACAKWVRKPKIGPTHYIRTCSNNLNMRMPIALVCMKESRPGDGRLCFCQRDQCNAASGPNHGSKLPMLIFSFMTLLWIHHYLSGYFYVTHWWTSVLCESIVMLSMVLPKRLVHVWRSHDQQDTRNFNAG